MIFADKLIQLRKKSGWSQEELAEQMDVSRQSVSKWEGAQSVPDLEKMVRLSKLFGVSTDYLLKDEMETPDGVAVEDAPARRVTMVEARAFLEAKASAARIIARATLLCIISPVCLILFGTLCSTGAIGMSEELACGAGMIVLLALVAAAVSQFIAAGGKTSPLRFMEREPFETEYGVRGMVGELQQSARESFNRACMAGVSVCILSVMPLFLGIAVRGSDLLLGVMVCLMLVIAGAGVYVLIRSSVVWSGYKRLLQQEEFAPEERQSRSLVGAVSGAYWLVAVAVYLAMSLPNDSWDRSWIVWPVAGVLYAAVRIAVSAIARGGKN